MKKRSNNREFVDSALVNSLTYYDYLDRLKKIALSIFEWCNLPDSMDERFLEQSLYYMGMAAMFKDNEYGFINTKVASSGDLNIYGLPTKLECFSFDFSKNKDIYTGLETDNDNSAILVMNNWEKTPTARSLELFALRMYEAERSADVNIKSTKTPVLIVGDEKQKLMLQNLYNQYDGNQPVIFGDKNQLNTDSLKVLKTDAPYVADKLLDYKKEIWNEALQFLGINAVTVDKKERLVAEEASSNNEVTNLNLQSYLIPRQKAAEQFNKLYNLTGDKAVYVRVRSDLHNIIKNSTSSVVDDYKPDSEVVIDG